LLSTRPHEYEPSGDTVHALDDVEPVFGLKYPGEQYVGAIAAVVST
jgi:hypothetical protein